ncbi:unnamed protein product, partial [Aphanomyces euteiches]
LCTATNTTHKFSIQITKPRMASSLCSAIPMPTCSNLGLSSCTKKPRRRTLRSPPW